MLVMRVGLVLAVLAGAACATHAKVRHYNVEPSYDNVNNREEYIDKAADASSQADYDDEANEKNNEPVNIEPEKVRYKSPRRKYDTALIRKVEADVDERNELLPKLKPKPNKKSYNTVSKTKRKEFVNDDEVRVRRVDRFIKDRKYEGINVEYDDEVPDFGEVKRPYVSRTDRLRRRKPKGKITVLEEMGRDSYRKRNVDSNSVDNRLKTFGKSSYVKQKFDISDNYSNKEGNVDTDYHHHTKDGVQKGMNSEEFDEYSGYYDTKIKNTLPYSLRQNKASTVPTQITSSSEDDPMLSLPLFLFNQARREGSFETVTNLPNSTTALKKTQSTKGGFSKVYDYELVPFHNNKSELNKRDQDWMLEPVFPNTKLTTEPNKTTTEKNIVEFQDTPQNLKLVKKLMRYNLMKNAKNISELLKNGDEMICDYIDVSLLNAAGAPAAPAGPAARARALAALCVGTLPLYAFI